VLKTFLAVHVLLPENESAFDPEMLTAIEAEHGKAID
jgi:hypothetical protein